MIFTSALTFLTLVVGGTLASAATPAPQPDLSRPRTQIRVQESATDDAGARQEILETTNVLRSGPPPVIKDETLEAHYFFKQAVTPRVGIFLDLNRGGPDALPDTTLGLSWTLPSESALHWEVTVDA